jgi:hypothetical protein
MMSGCMAHCKYDKSTVHHSLTFSIALLLLLLPLLLQAAGGAA